jgi:hypothetical protein
VSPGPEGANPRISAGFGGRATGDTFRGRARLLGRAGFVVGDSFAGFRTVGRPVLIAVFDPLDQVVELVRRAKVPLRAAIAGRRR